MEKMEYLPKEETLFKSLTNSYRSYKLVHILSHKNLVIKVKALHLIAGLALEKTKY